MSTRGGKAALRALLALQLTVFGYDRRGRGDSGDTLPYAVDREIEDIQALIEVAGGTAALYGHSSGAALALDAALQLGDSVSKIAMYEAPYNDDPAARQTWRRYLEQLTEALATGCHGDTVALFMAYVGTRPSRSTACAGKTSGRPWRRWGTPSPMTTPPSSARTRPCRPSERPGWPCRRW
jgi:pimeloyl-ACP methyl ester carboxylesterase